MSKNILGCVILLLVLTACETPGVGGEIPGGVGDAPTLISPQPATQTPELLPGPRPSATANVTAPLSPSPSASARANCVDSAVFLADLTISDNTKLKAGEPFTKTWQLRNTGNCAWDAGYSLVFTGGNRMDSPKTVPLTDTAPNATLDLSVDLKAPASDGVFIGLYEIHNPQGKAIPIGLTKSMWVKIRVGDVIVVQPTETAAGGGPKPTGNPTTRPDGPCNPEQYATELVTLINAARASAGLRGLDVNAKLTAAAQGHSDDMACHNFFSHTGSNGSSIQDRIVAAGYSPSDWGEIIYAGGSAQQAFDWWMNDPPHRDIILDPNMKHVGAGYTYVAGSEYGGYFTVDFGAQ